VTADWKRDGLCLTQGHPDDWFASSDGRYGSKAAAICAECPVRDACLTAALETGEPWGIWGGMTPEQRERLLNKRKPGPSRRPIKHGTEAGYFAHRRRGEDACDDCRLATNAATKRRRTERKKEAA
jgi:hypothetical protein